MSLEQVVQWVALPAGGSAGDGLLAVSVAVAPRLRTDEAITLAPFTDWHDWPARIREASFALEVNGTLVPAAVASEPADSDLWTALFGPDTPLRPFAFDDFADRPLVTFSVAAITDALRTIYTEVAAASPDELAPIFSRSNVEPQVNGLVDLLADLRNVTQQGVLEGARDDTEVKARIARLLQNAREEAGGRRGAAGVRGGPLIEPLPADGSLARHLQRALVFHTRTAEQPVDLPDAAEHYHAQVDFHRMISALGDHPWLMRRLGLVIDLTVESSTVDQASLVSPGQIAVRPAWDTSLPADSTDVLPATAYAYVAQPDQLHFRAATRHPDPAAPPDAPPTGLLSLPGASFSAEQVDVDGAALKALNFAVTVQTLAARGGDQRPIDHPDTAGIPALRTGGLALVHSGRADGLQQAFTRSLEINDGIEGAAPKTLYAEDLARGLRLDVLDTRTGTWRSLHQRIVHASAQRHPEPLAPAADEGYFQLSLAGAPTWPEEEPDPNGELYVHETLATWDGWSLSAPRPGKSLSPDPRAPHDDAPETQPQHVANEPLTAMGLSIEASAMPGTLPRLRFGRSYRLRARTVDLAGNGPTLADADSLLASPATASAIVPAQDAAPYLRFEPIPAPTLVPAQRFGEGASLLRLVIRSAPDENAATYAERFNSSELVLNGGHASYAATDDRHVAAPKAALELVERHGRLDPVIGSDGMEASAEQVAEIRAAYDIARRESGSFDDATGIGAEAVELSSDPASPQHYVIRFEDQLTLPYLPDPLAAGVVVFGLPGRQADAPLRIMFDADPWYAAAPFRLRLYDGQTDSSWDPDARELAVGLPQATATTIRVCSILDEIDTMGIVRWCEETLDGPALDRVLHAAKDNRCWLLTPWHEVSLVHAVQQPLQVPEWAEFRQGRYQGATEVHLSGQLALHPASTEKIDLVAEWEETVDDLAARGPQPRAGRAVVFDLSLRVAAQTPPGAGPHDSPYSLIDDKLLSFSTPNARELGLPSPAPHKFGDTHYRRVTYTAVATTPYREDFPADWSEHHPELLSVTSEPQTVDVLSSAPPAAPRLLYVVPTQGWEAHADGPTTTRRRRGGGLRVYLDRPWYSSGDGELLGVVIGSPVTDQSGEDWPYTTVFSRDPVRAAPPLQSARKEMFPTAVLSDGRVRLLEVPERLFELVSFVPQYDEPTQRWFCDIDIDTELSYMPFVRLALVRHQPKSLDGCTLSPVVLSDIVQTLPHRTLTVIRTPTDTPAVDVSVAGPAYAAIHGPAGVRSDPPALSRIIARIERRVPGIADELLGWAPIDGAQVELTPAVAGDLTTWSGHLTMPAGDGHQRRLVVVEQDHLTVDADTPGTDGLAGRIVYADTIAM